MVIESDVQHGDCDFAHSVTKVRNRNNIFEEVKDSMEELGSNYVLECESATAMHSAGTQAQVRL